MTNFSNIDSKLIEIYNEISKPLDEKEDREYILLLFCEGEVNEIATCYRLWEAVVIAKVYLLEDKLSSMPVSAEVKIIENGEKVIEIIY